MKKKVHRVNPLQVENTELKAQLSATKLAYNLVVEKFNNIEIFDDVLQKENEEIKKQREEKNKIIDRLAQAFDDLKQVHREELERNSKIRFMELQQILISHAETLNNFSQIHTKKDF